MTLNQVVLVAALLGLFGCVSDFGVSDKDLKSSKGWVLVDRGPGYVASRDHKQVSDNVEPDSVGPNQGVPEPVTEPFLLAQEDAASAVKSAPVVVVEPLVLEEAAGSAQATQVSSVVVKPEQPDGESIRTAAAVVTDSPAETSKASRNSLATQCHAFLSNLQKTLQAFAISAGGGQVLADFPFLRSNRALAASAVQLNGADVPAAVVDVAWNSWFERSIALSNIGWSQAWKNLPAAQQARLLRQSQLVDIAKLGRKAANARFPTKCMDMLLRAAFREAESQGSGVQGFYQKVARQASVASEYRQLQRTLGAYPVTRLGPKVGLTAHRKRFQEYFATPMSSLPVEGELQRYYAMSQGTSAATSTAASKTGRQPADGVASRDPMRWPDVSAEFQERLWERYAPIWEVDTVSEDDSVGYLEWRGQGGGSAKVNLQLPTEYRYLSHQWLAGEWRLQLNYQVWMPARSKSSATDILAGALDSVIWRVTVDDAGEPLVFDSVHACGCYHVVLPMPGWRQTKASESWPEPPLLVNAASALAQRTEGQRLLLRLSARSHYLQGVEWVDLDKAVGRSLEVRDYDELWSLPVANDSRSALLPRRPAFDARGIVRGSERAERYLLWPMGIIEPGAMRAAGRHAIAFVGERHFDDWNLLESMLSRR